MIKRLFIVSLVAFCHLATWAQGWTAPKVPAEDLNNLSSSEVVYFYNVEADAFLLNGMTWGTNACATRLVNGDAAEADPQRCYALVSNGNVQIRLKKYNTFFISCHSENANDIYVDQNINTHFSYTETPAGSHVYTLNNTYYRKNLDVTWDFGGHLTITDGAGHTKWAFIKESTITSGRYQAYKVKKQMYGVYKDLADAGKADLYSKYLSEALKVYEQDDATVKQVTEAARSLFWAVYADIKNPVDVSFLFDEADMSGYGDLANWGTNATFGWGEFEVYHQAMKLSQVQQVPQGLYDVAFQALYREDGSGSAPQIRVTGEQTTSADVVAIDAIDYAVGNAEWNNWIVKDNKVLPDGMQSCSQALTHGNTLVWVKDVKVGNSGQLTLSAEMKSAEQWFNWQRFVVVYKGLGEASLKDGLLVTITEAEKLYGDGLGKGAEALKAVLDAAKGVFADETATQSAIVMANSDLQEAIKTYRWGAATLEHPVDVTYLILNNSFEKGQEHWENTNFAFQTNNAFSLKSGNTYVEKWTSAGGAVGNASMEQHVKGLEPGIYVLKAVAQNIQEGNEAIAQSNAWIVANNTREEVTGRDEYALVFTNIESEINVGFVAEGATGNWISVDHFRLYYAGGEFVDLKKELQNYIASAQFYLDKKIHNAALSTLQSCITAAQDVLNDDNATRYTGVATPLRKAMEEAKVSMAAYKKLDEAIAKAEVAYGGGTLNGANKFKTTIDGAKAVNDNLNATYEQIEQQIVKLEKATFEYYIANPSGTVPTVITDKRFARGAIAAFGRMTVSGVSPSDILEEGFCWSTEPEPTVLDNRTTRYLENNGRIYWMEMTPATVYYIRAYAITKKYAVGYGKVIKMSTLPQGQVTYWYNNGGDEAHNNRINTALTIATTYWSNYTSIRGFNVSCSFSPGTPTADCGYGGNMRIGTNMGQRAGTCLHEMNHGIGGGTLEIWGGWSVSPLRKTINGYWAGDRANEAVRFWENRDELTISGAYDGAHWGVLAPGETYSQDNTYQNKYPHNGAHLEPGAWAGPKNENDTEIFYIGNALINQGFCEDGLIPVNFYSGAFCLPAYVFEQDDHAKYYIKNESAEHGLASSYLVEQANGRVKWIDLQGQNVTLNDSAAWYVSFTPDNQYYQFRNAATGRYLTFADYGTNGIKTVAKTTPAANEDFHLMKGRIDVTLGHFITRGYWIIHPEAKSNPATFTALKNGTVSANTLDLFDAATAQRWIFLQADEIEPLENGLKEMALDELEAMIANVRSLLATGHTEDELDADASLESDLAAIEALAANVLKAAEVAPLIEQVRAAGMNFLAKVTPKSIKEPFDITFLVENAAIDNNNGWSATPAYANSCCEYFEQSFDFNQTVSGLPAGTYQLNARAFQRPGAYDAAYKAYESGTNNVSAYLYAGDKSQKLCHIAEGARRLRLHDDDVEVSSGSKTYYIPNTMASAAAYLKLKPYENTVVTSLEEDDSKLKIGIRSSDMRTAYWTIFDNFRLYFYGSISPETVTSVEKIEANECDKDEIRSEENVYNLQGQKVGKSLKELPRGIYIVGRKKVMVK